MARKMKDSGIEWIGQIPENWNVLKNKYNFINLKTLVGNEWYNMQLLSLTKNGIKKIKDGEQTGKVPESFTTYQKVNKNDIVMCLFDLDVSAVFSGISNYEGMISPAYKCLKCKDHLVPQYIDYYFKTVFVDRKYKRYSKNVRYSLSIDDFMCLPIIVPSKLEQQKIAYYLDKKCNEIDLLHSDIKKQIKTLEEYKKSVITEAVTKGLNPDVEMKDSGIEWIGQIPENWDNIRIKDAFTRKKSKSNQKDPIILSLARSGVKIRDISNNEGQLAEDYSNYNPVAVDDILLNPMDLISGDNCNISEVEGVISPAYVNLRYKDGVNPKFYNYYFKYQYWCMAFFAYGKGVSFENRWTLNGETIERFPIVLPSETEQQLIANFLEKKCTEIDGVITDKKKQLEVLEQYKKSLIYEYVTGKKEIK